MSEETQPRKAPTPWWQHPIGTGLIGLVLVVLGWQLIIYTPARPGGGVLDGLRQQADEQGGEEGTAGLPEKLREWAERQQAQAQRERAQRHAPFKLAGQLVLAAGLILFITAGVRMWRHEPPAVDQVEQNEV